MITSKEDHVNALNENNSPVEKIIDRVVEDEKNGIRIYTIEKVIDGILERLELGADEYVVDQICKWTLSRGGIHSDEDYDRFQAMVEEAFGEGDEHGTYLGNLPLLKADRWYIDVSGIDPLDLPLPKWERDRQAAPPRPPLRRRQRLRLRHAPRPLGRRDRTAGGRRGDLSRERLWGTPYGSARPRPCCFFYVTAL